MDPSRPGEQNYDCPCVDNLPYGPCGDLWRKVSCLFFWSLTRVLQFMREKEIEKLPEEQTTASYRSWFECFSTNATIYMPEFLKDMEKRRRDAEKKVTEEMSKVEQSPPEES